MEWYLAPWQKFATFSGRARRKEYWMFVIINAVIQQVLSGVGIAIMGEAGVFLGSIFALVTLVPTIAVAVRRMHDVGKSGWFMLIPIYNFILAVSDSEHGENQYGRNPKGLGNEEGNLEDHFVA
ncbi:DUF805 domain-containing protein [Saprospira grandis]|uniref:Cytochrome n=1 Tax=Saprospira grandis (strain Lewin) TaxID=984262 RepID=H6L706_SAPGL|nr:DUF805 domain-containing protein [Saprospira grandis]AFC26436.1 cytochrome [Saprospira grandis str. Lewin]